MKSFILNGNDFTTKEMVHKILKETLELPSYYGENLDALWDCLTTEIEVPIKITWNNFDESKKYLGEYCNALLNTLQEASNYLNDDFILEVNN
ncbi:MAG: barstar family protein [Clostridium sp.]|uniref:barstar family protein n=1 Tax=Clostridium sp. TaxID=1506 RepID=UPI003022EE56